MIEIRKGKHLNMDAIIMESKFIRLKLLPELGFKMASFEYIPKDKELLFQPTEKLYNKPKYGADFEKYDTSGLDEMLPTIDECNYKGHKLPDHGEVWSIPWDIEISDGNVSGKIRLNSLPLEFYKTLTFKEENIVKVEYKVKNLSDEKIDFLWALHGLNTYDDEIKIIIPDEPKDILNVHQNDVLGSNGKTNSFPLAKDENGNMIDLSLLKNYKDNRSYKYYFLNQIEKGEVGLHYTKENIMYILKYDPKKIPYLGVWITKGGFKGEYNVAIEPSTGFYDSLELAVENNKTTKLLPYEEFLWSIYMEVRKS